VKFVSRKDVATTTDSLFEYYVPVPDLVTNIEELPLEGFTNTRNQYSLEEATLLLSIPFLDTILVLPS
jgi:hypothetical protein